jgi:hypothetical protein
VLLRVVVFAQSVADNFYLPSCERVGLGFHGCCPLWVSCLCYLCGALGVILPVNT